MSDRIALAIVVAEDLRSGRLIARYMKSALNSREVRLVIAPSGQQSAYDWVQQQYPAEVNAHRSRVRRGKNLSALAVHLDADEGSVARRHQQLAEALARAGAVSRQPGERICLVVPRRNTETWLHGLSGVPVDEEYDFKRDPEGRIAGVKRLRDRLCDERMGAAAGRLYDLTRPHAVEPPVTMPSLTVAVSELRRLEN